MSEQPQTKLIKPRTKAGKRALEKRAPKLVRSLPGLFAARQALRGAPKIQESRWAPGRNACMPAAAGGGSSGSTAPRAIPSG